MRIAQQREYTVVGGKEHKARAVGGDKKVALGELLGSGIDNLFMKHIGGDAGGDSLVDRFGFRYRGTAQCYDYGQKCSFHIKIKKGHPCITQVPMFVFFQPFKASEPLTISMISLVIEAWRALL